MRQLSCDFPSPDLDAIRQDQEEAAGNASDLVAPERMRDF